MARLEPRLDDQLGELEDVLAVGETRLGFRPNSQKTMAWQPEFLRSYQNLAQAVFLDGAVSRELKTMLSHIASYAGQVPNAVTDADFD